MLKFKSLVLAFLFCCFVSVFAVADKCFEAQKKYHLANDSADIIRDSLRIAKLEVIEQLVVILHRSSDLFDCSNGTICFYFNEEEIKKVVESLVKEKSLRERSDSLHKQINEALDETDRFCK